MLTNIDTDTLTQNLLRYERLPDEVLEANPELTAWVEYTLDAIWDLSPHDPHYTLNDTDSIQYRKTLDALDHLRGSP